MKKFLILGVLLLALVSTTSAMAASSVKWKPGNPYYISEEDAYSLLEKTYDSAYCTGIPRFGHQGEFPYEEFIIFDCDVSMHGNNGFYCSDQRYKGIKGSRPGYFRLKLIRHGDCY